MDPFITESVEDKAYAKFSLSDPKRGLMARWHDYFGTLAEGETIPSEAQQFRHGAVIIRRGTAGRPLATFENGETAAKQRVLKMD